jgi:prepilin-type N-terminal cleavage/methylation domain-containing protein
MHREAAHAGARDVLRDDQRTARPGFSLIELMAAMVISSVVMVAVLGMFTTENGRFSQQRELSDTWLTLRSAAELIDFDVRQASASGGDLSALTDTSFTVRSRRGSAVICGKSTTGYSLTEVTGDFSADAGDSVKVMTVQSTPVWKNLDVAAVGNPGTIGPLSCAWSGSTAPTTGVRVTIATAADTSNVAIGSPVHAFRSTQYGIVTSANRRWLGRKVSGAATWELVTGPLRTDGLRLTYYTSAGAITTTPAEVAAVRLTLRAESFGRTTQRKAMQDTLTVRVQVNN